MGEWTETTLGEVLELKRGYDLPQQDRRAGTFPIVSSSGITDHHDMPMAKGPGVVTGRYGTLGQVFYVEQNFWPLNTTLYVRDFKGNNPRFVGYFLQSFDFFAYSDKAAVPGLNRNDLHQAVIVFPKDHGEQRAIASILGALDDKIALNRRMSETLEATARALFKSWFVDFDPVKEKAKGSQLGLTTATAHFFPKTFVEADIGNIPEGWSVASIADHFDAVKGVSYKGEGLSDEGMPLHNLNSVLEGGGYKYAGVKYYNGDYRDRHVTEPGDVIIANTEQGHDRLLIGYAAIVPKAFGARGIASHHIYRLRRKTTSPLTNHFICRLLNSPQMHDIVSGYANGTTVNMLPIDGVQKPQIIVPPKDLVAVFDSFARVQQDRLEELIAENSILASLRDTLLPKLISGELRIKDAERFVEAAV